MKKALTITAAVAASILLLALTAILAGVLNGEISRRMDEMRDKTISELEQFLGKKIRYGSISPSFLRSIEIRDLALLDESQTGAPLLTVHRLRLYYSLARLIATRDPVAALSEVRIVSSRFSIDLEKDRELIELVMRLAQNDGAVGGAAGGAVGASPLRARLTGENVGITVRSPQGDVNVGGLFFEVGAHEDVLSVQLRGNLDGSLADGFSFSTNVKASGKVGRGFDWSDMMVRVQSFTSSVFATGRQTVQVVWKGSELSISKIQDRSPIDLRVAADLDARTLTVALKTEEFQPDRLLRLTGSWARLNPWLKAPITATGSATYGLDDHSLVYDAEVQGSFTDQLPVHDVVLESRLHGTGRQIWFEPLRLDSPTGSLDFTGNLVFSTFFPEGMLTLTDFNAWEGDKVNARVAVQRLGGRLEIKGTHASVGSIAFDRLEAAADPVRDGLRFTMSASFAGVQDDEISAAGMFSRGAASLTASLRGVPADQLYHLALGAVPLSGGQQDMKGFLGPLSLTADLNGTTDLRTFTVSSPRLSVAHASDPGTAVTAGVELSNDHLSITGLDGAWQGIALRGDLHGEMDPAGRISFSTGVRVRDIPYEVKGSWSIAEGLTATGSYGLAVSASRGRTGVLGLRARAEKLPLPVPGGPGTVSFDVQGSFPAQGEWAISAASVEVVDLPFLESRANSLELSMRLTPRRLEADRIRFSDAFSKLEGSAEADISGLTDPVSSRTLDHLVVLARGTLQARGATESYAVRGALRDGVLSAELEFAGSPVARLGDLAVKGLLAGRGTVTGPLSAPVVDLALSLKEGKLGTDPLTASGRVGLAGDTLSLRDLTIGYVAHRLAAGEGSLDLGAGSFALTGLYTGEYFMDTVRFAAGLSGTFPAGRAQGMGSHPFEQEIKGTLALSRITVNTAAMPGWEVRIRTENGALRLDGGPGDAVHGTLNPDMSFRFTTTRPLPFTAVVDGRITGDRISATADLASGDLRVLNAMMKSPVISFTSGVASGRVSAEGPLNDPDFSGSLDVIGGGLLARSYCPDEIGPISTRFTFDGKLIRGGPVTATAGPGKARGEMTLTMDHWIPVDFDISFATEEGSAVRVAVRFGSLIADGLATGGARIKGNERRTDVTGSAVVSDCRISLGAYQEAAFVPEEAPTFVSFVVQTGKRVEFTWPSETFPVLRTTAAAGGKVDVTYRGDTGGYTVKGSTGVRGGEIFYFDRSFIVKTGSIAFDESEKAFDPRITARAEVREWDPGTAEEVKIYLEADSRLSEFAPRFSSDPSRTDVEILSMIGAPLRERADEQGLGISALMLSSDILSQFGILRPFEQRIRQLLNLDMFSIRTQIVQNLVAQKVFGVELNPLDNTALSLGKYLGNDLFLEMLVRLQSREAVAGSSSPTGTLTSEVELNIEWATPFFLLEWSFLPKTPETLFLADNSLSMKWRYSY